MDGAMRPGTVVLVLGDDLIQVGSSPGHSFTLTNLSVEDEHWLRDLVSPASSDSQRPIPPAKLVKLNSNRRKILDQLRRHGLLVESSTRRQIPLLGDLKARVVGLDRVGVSVARLLRLGGVRHLDLRDSRPIDHEVEYLFPPEVKGLSRMKTLQEEMRANRTFLSRQSDPHVVLTIENRAVEPGRARLLWSNDVAHLPIVVDDRSIQVGPLSLPSLQVCVLCLDYHRTDYLPRWPAVREELRRAPAPFASPATAMVAAGLAVQQIESIMNPLAAANVDELTTSPWYRGLSWRVFEGGVETLRWESHPRCECGTSTAQAAG